MTLHLVTIGDTGSKFLDNKYVSPPNPLTMDEMVEKMNHNTMLNEISSTLNYV